MCIRDSLKMYQGVLCEALEQKNVTAASSFREFQGLRQRLKINDSEHQVILEKLLQEQPQLFSKIQASSDEPTIVRFPKSRHGNEPTIVNKPNSRPGNEPTVLNKPNFPPGDEPTIVYPKKPNE